MPEHRSDRRGEAARDDDPLDVQQALQHHGDVREATNFGDAAVPLPTGEVLVASGELGGDEGAADGALGLDDGAADGASGRARALSGATTVWLRR